MSEKINSLLKKMSELKNIGKDMVKDMSKLKDKSNINKTHKKISLQDEEDKLKSENEHNK